MEKLDKNIEKIKKLYLENKLSSISIGKIFNVSHTTILNTLNKFKISRRNDKDYLRKYNYNINYFENIDSKDKAYFLGLLLADGCIQSKKGQIIIKLQERDNYILELFNKYINSNKPIHHIKVNNHNHSDMKSLSFNSQKMCLDLNRLGMCDNKSLTLEFPNIPYNLLNHFIRGYFDGDGCITIPNNKPTLVHIDFCVSKYFGEKLQKIMNNLGYNPTFFTQKLDSIHHLGMSGRIQIIKFLTWLYKDKNDLFLHRKYEKFLLIKNYVKLSKINSTSKYNGIYFSKKHNKYIGSIELGNKKRLHLGYFDKDIEGGLVYNRIVQFLKLNNKTLNNINYNESINYEFVNNRCKEIMNKCKGNVKP